jgi:formamidopyrimidine-DNA glycosylase
MPELPDITVYLEALERRIRGHNLEKVQITSPFLLRTATPPISSVEGRIVLNLRRLGKRICIGLEDELWLVIHLMIAGRLHWQAETRKSLSARGSSKFKAQLALFQFDAGTLSLTEAGTQRRASLHLVQGQAGLSSLDRGGVELFTSQKPDPGVPGRAVRLGWGGKGGQPTLGKFIGLASFARVLQSENHTLKRALTDPRLLSGIGNAYSDEILWHAQLSPVKLTQKLSDEEIARLHAATRDTLIEWVERLRAEAGEGFPEKVTAFRTGMATHGRYKEPCPRCGTPIQRIRYAANETNYCPTCQTGGKLLADRALSRLLREDWPKTVEELG